MSLMYHGNNTCCGLITISSTVLDVLYGFLILTFRFYIGPKYIIFLKALHDEKNLLVQI